MATGTIRANQFLTNFAIAYSQQLNFIARKVMPPLTNVPYSGLYHKFLTKDIISRIPNAYRAPGTPANRSPFEVSYGSFRCENIALKEPVTYEDRKNTTGNSLDLVDAAVRQVTETVLLDYEMQAAAQMFSATVFSGYTDALGAADRFDNYEDSNPFVTVQAGKTAVLKTSLKQANALVMGQEVFDQLAYHPDVLAKISGGATNQNPAVAGEMEMAKAFGVDQVIVGRGVYNSANKGQTATGAFIWGKKLLVCYIDPAPTIKSVSVAKTMMAEDFQVRDWYDPETKSDWYEAGMYIDPVVVAPGAGYLLTTVVN